MAANRELRIKMTEGIKNALCTPIRVMNQLDISMLMVELARNPVDNH